MFASKNLEQLRQQKQLLMAKGEAQRLLIRHDCAALYTRLQWIETPWKAARLALPWLKIALPLWQLWCTPTGTRRPGSWADRITAGIALGQRLSEVWRRLRPAEVPPTR